VSTQPAKVRLYGIPMMAAGREMGVDHLEAVSLDIPGSLEIETPKKSRPPDAKALLAQGLREVKRAGLKVSGAVIEANRVTLTFGEPVKTGENELDEWEAKHVHKAKGH
jgi:hypothetical protein